jgi:hypothetical protein
MFDPTADLGHQPCGVFSLSGNVPMMKKLLIGDADSACHRPPPRTARDCPQSIQPNAESAVIRSIRHVAPDGVGCSLDQDGRCARISLIRRGQQVTVIWFVIWLIANNVGGRAPLLFSPVNAWTATLILAIGLDLGAAHARGTPKSR